MNVISLCGFGVAEVNFTTHTESPDGGDCIPNGQMENGSYVLSFSGKWSTIPVNKRGVPLGEPTILDPRKDYRLSILGKGDPPQEFVETRSVVLDPGYSLMALSTESFYFDSAVFTREFDDLLGLVFPLKQLALYGLIVTAPPLMRGHNGPIPLHVYNSSDRPIRLHSGDGCANLVFTRDRLP